MPRSAFARSRAAFTAHRMLSVPPLVMKPATPASPCSSDAVQPHTSLWISPSDGNAFVLSAFSCKNSRATASAISCTSGPPS